MRQETWYVLDDGSVVDPNEVTSDKSGILRHKSGAAVAMRGDVPSTRSVDPDEERSKARAASAKQQDAPPKSDRQMRAGDDERATYKTR